MKYFVLLMYAMGLFLIPTATAYNRYYSGTINLTMVYNVVNSIPREYFSNLGSLTISEGNCIINGTRKAYEGYYYYSYRIEHIFGLRIYGYVSKADIWVCNLGERRYDEDYFKETLLHEIGHHFQMNVLKQFDNLSEEYAEGFVKSFG